MSPILKTLTVIGGNGFLGKRICQSAVLNGFNVISLSRSGTPPLSISHSDHEWISKVQWEKLNVFEPKSYIKQLQKTDVLVHTLGILLESNYKSSLNSSGANLRNALSTVHDAISPNPMKKTISNSYDEVNRKSAIISLTNFVKSTKTKKIPKFVYISADKAFPGLPKGYINSKRAAEAEILKLSNQDKFFTSLIVRPGFMFDECIHGDLRSNFSSALGMLNTANEKLLNGALSGLIGPTVSTQTVAKKIIDSIEEDRNGILLLEQICN